MEAKYGRKESLLIGHSIENIDPRIYRAPLWTKIQKYIEIRIAILKLKSNFLILNVNSNIEN